VKTNKCRILYLPIEFKKREFLSKLLLACVAAKNEFVVIIGTQSKLRKVWRKLPKGIYFHKDILPARIEKKEFFDQIEYGNRFVALDEEGLLFDSEERYLKIRAHKATIDSLDFLFTWGKYHTDVLKKRYPDISRKLIQAGNPRIDLLRSEFRDVFSDQKKLIKKQYGKIILINSSFISCEYIGGDDERKKKFNDLKEINQEQAIIVYNTVYKQKEKLYKEFIKMIHELSFSFKDYTIVIRPHPVESSRRWKYDTRNFSNVDVVHGGNVIPYILASDMLIHNNCTTGIEAFLLEKPVITFAPFYVENNEYSISNNLSCKVESVSGLLEIARKIIAGEHYEHEKNLQRKKYLKQYISAIDSSLASERIVDALIKLDTEPQRLKLTYLYNLVRYCEIFYSLAKSSIEGLIEGKEAQERHKTGDISMDDVANGIKKFQKASGGFSTIKSKPLFRNSFIVMKKENFSTNVNQDC